MALAFSHGSIGFWRSGRARLGAMDNRVGVVAGAAAAAVASVLAAKALSMSMTPPKPPVLAKKEHRVPFGVVEGQNRGENPMNPPIFRDDPYFWARDDSRKDREIIEHLEKENKYTDRIMKPLKHKREELYRELLSHVQETDSTVPYKFGPYMYYTRTVEGSSYKIHCRKALHSGDEQILLDENVLAKGQKHCDIGAVMPSPSHELLAYSVDTTGYETYAVKVMRIEDGLVVDEYLQESAGNLAWGKTDKYLFYSTFDDAHRVNKIWRHETGKDASTDELLLTEDNEIFSAFFGKSRCGRFMFIGSASSETSEYRFLDFNDEDSAHLHMVAPKQKGTLYSVVFFDDKFHIVTNKDGAVNFKIMTAPVESSDSDSWTDLFPYDEKIKVDSIDAFKDFAVVEGREDGFTQLWLLRNQRMDRVKFDEDSYTVYGSVNKEFDTNVYRFKYSSLTTPAQTIEMNVNSGERKLLKEEPVLNFDRSLYKSERLEAKTDDGTIIPISLMYKKDLFDEHREPKPCYLYGYGSYEISIDPAFKSSYLPIVDRDVVLALAHIRGGGEMGRLHYENAKYLKKRNTFEDFIACAEKLVSMKYTSSDKLAIEGRSAGGLLIGAVINMRPDLFRAAHAGVPFVDVMNTMSDPTIPLTTGEWEEWGNPNEEKYHDYMLSYSPYDNVRQAEYPALLITSGLFDPRVAYWEPTKWVAKLRENNTGERPLLLKMDLSSGHFSASDRYKWYRERAFELTFLLNELGVLK
eukprot:Plantae.Rhodophyta-Purpureofilum_apyrenoidigerum.ctg2312.p1 GENE.Plantae.Rhodophyta-Purpureofilum_apyrenoidigerum.ctg2312~~Plantae.Rhodophyta-Purpureofilum_apyrenoidigerum.ctg2312.p1  ORF type:complete len:749 (+),score=156.12 Plantae.Rhodophyta-Purpureofilum_apyrenoidigerum.ctg2312:1275-3521(+)